MLDILWLVLLKKKIKTFSYEVRKIISPYEKSRPEITVSGDMEYEYNILWLQKSSVQQISEKLSWLTHPLETWKTTLKPPFYNPGWLEFTKEEIQASLKRSLQLKINYNMNEQSVLNKSSILTQRSQNFEIICITKLK